MGDRQLAVIDVQPGSAMESQSGLQMLRPRIYGAYEQPAGARTGVIVIHPTSNFMGHYLIAPLVARGICCLGLNTRYQNNDTMLLMERAIQDLGAGVKFLRGLGCDRVLLVGNSGGAALVSFYQAQAENLTVTQTPAGDPVDIVASDLPPADGIVLAAAHPGRSRIIREYLDASVIAEDDPVSADPALDIYNAENGPPFAPDFLARYTAAQQARAARIDAWVEGRLRFLAARPDGPRDQAFVVYRTLADPRFLDLGLDANDRPPGSIWGPPREVNYAANSMGRFTTLKAYMSQWSAKSQADGPDNLAKTSVPVLLLRYTADGATFPSHNRLWADAAGPRAEIHDVKNANHYLKDQPELVEEVADRIAAWAERI